MGRLNESGKHLQPQKDVTNLDEGYYRIVNCNYQGEKYGGILIVILSILECMMSWKHLSLILQKEVKLIGCLD